MPLPFSFSSASKKEKSSASREASPNANGANKQKPKSGKSWIFRLGLTNWASWRSRRKSTNQGSDGDGTPKPDYKGDGWVTPSRLRVLPRKQPENKSSTVNKKAGGKLVNPMAAAQKQQQPGAATSSEGVSNGAFFTEYGEGARYTLKEIIGKGSYGVVCSAIDNHTGERVAIKKINDVFDHVSDATRILREIKLVRHLKHPDIVQLKHILLPPSKNEFRDIYVIFELMETDLHQVIKANDDLSQEHHQFFLYQMLRGMKFIHSANVYHRDLKPKNILANADCKLKICDFGLARPQFSDQPSTVFWTDYVATRWYRAPELCGSFFARYSPAVDIWSVGCIFAEILNGRPLFPGRNVVHQLELITDLLGTPDDATLAKVRNDKARRFLQNMARKPGANFETHFPTASPGARRMLRRLLEFDADKRPSAEEALKDPYFEGLSEDGREPVAEPVSKLEYEFDRRKLTADEVRELIYREILYYHPNTEADYLQGNQGTYQFPSAVDNFKRQFDSMEETFDGMAAGGEAGRTMSGSKPLTRGAAPGMRSAMSLPRERVQEFQQEAAKYATAGGGGDGMQAPGAVPAPVRGGAGIISHATSGMPTPGLHAVNEEVPSTDATSQMSDKRFLKRCDST
ncbi:mitogen-activated protein kinase [Pycnococcus provasolii]